MTSLLKGRRILKRYHEKKLYKNKSNISPCPESDLNIFIKKLNFVEKYEGNKNYIISSENTSKKTHYNTKAKDLIAELSGKSLNESKLNKHLSCNRCEFNIRPSLDFEEKRKFRGILQFYRRSLSYSSFYTKFAKNSLKKQEKSSFDNLAKTKSGSIQNTISLQRSQNLTYNSSKRKKSVTNSIIDNNKGLNKLNPISNSIVGSFLKTKKLDCNKKNIKEEYSITKNLPENHYQKYKFNTCCKFDGQNISKSIPRIILLKNNGKYLKENDGNISIENDKKLNKLLHKRLCLRFNGNKRSQMPRNSYQSEITWGLPSNSLQTMGLVKTKSSQLSEIEECPDTERFFDLTKLP